MKILPKTKAIDFSVYDIDHNLISLKSYQGKRILLSFYRYASCPLCNLRVHELIETKKQFEAYGIELIAVFQSSIEQIKMYVGSQDVPFPIIADPEQKLYKLYGVKTSIIKTLLSIFKLNRMKEAHRKGYKIGKSDGPITRVPADFLINEHFVVELSYYGKDISDHLPIKEIFDQFEKTERKRNHYEEISCIMENRSHD